MLVLLIGLGMGPRPVSGFVPFDLSNFLASGNEYACDNSSVRIVRPKTVEDVAEAVRLFSHVKAVGGGWSWNQPFFCASNGSAPPNPNGYGYGKNGSALAGAPPPPVGGTANIVMTTLRPLLIEVDEQGQSVTVDAGVRTIDLLRYLADYVTPTAPSGYTLPAFPWFVFQTLGGAVSTGTHGSSLSHKSLSSQVLELTVVLANGTVRTFSDETDPFLMKALRVSVGQLGIIVHIKFRIVPEMPVTRTLHRLTATQYLAMLRAAQARSGRGGAIGSERCANQWNTQGDLPAWMESTEFFWVPQRHEYIDISRSGVFAIAANTTKEALLGYLYQPEAILDVNIRKVPFDQYETAMPVASMADCWQGLLELLYGADNLDGRAYNGTVSPLSLLASLTPNGTAALSPSVIAPNGRPDYGFRSNPLIRTTGREDALLSNTEDGPRLWLNIEDYLYYNRPVRRTNVVFKRLMGYLRSDPRCGPTGIGGGGARLHWGKAGWPDAGCWHGDKEFPNTWCDFGCAVRQLDPKDKLRDSAPDRWTWEGVPLEQCCGPDGFRRGDPACTCRVKHARTAATCPPPPFYTYR
ncbi:D-arabinono-1,4-lactone oxidase [Tetrabaena socialis]|uniref:D-arabinono-1,4-lactone oxidase n=1 Tax=Tetrabaena socialis TaxID=47790 RepID=A0A2J8AG42_9CHLO|nr:D-arabinono-1,4-lactone oxidase [Tetrabaena socialis]|eukprot:PNH11479.1 D-arabinono-1,4-lactone oxidase [Tetrabaena socialis]